MTEHKDSPPDEEPEDNPGEMISAWDMVILILSIVILAAMAIDLSVPLDKETRQLLWMLDTAICIVFLSDFFIRLWRAEDKKKFLKWGWIDFVASIPMIEPLRWARAVRVFRILRLLRAFKSGKTVLAYIFRNRAQGAFSAAFLTAALFIVFSSLSVLAFEKDAPGANILTAGDALWWSVVTITTVGYGDYFPVTVEGRMIATVLMMVGIGLFGTISGTMASILFKGASAIDEPSGRLQRLDHTTREILRRLEDRSWNHLREDLQGTLKPTEGSDKGDTKESDKQD